MQEINEDAVRALYDSPCCGTYSSLDGCCIAKHTQDIEEMLYGFDEETKNLTDEEIVYARTAYRVMMEAFKQEQSITNSGIAVAIKMEHDVDVTPARIRKMVSWMHKSRHLSHLVASSKGYGWAKTDDELREYAKSLLGRIKSIQGRYNAVLKTLNQKQLQQ